MYNSIKAIRINSNSFDLTKVINTIIDDFNFKTLDGVLCHNMYQNVIDGEDVIQLTTDKSKY